jgi:hypothetical protein
MENNTLLFLNIKTTAPMRSMNQLRRIIKLIISLREGPDANPIFTRLSKITAYVYDFILYSYIIDDFFYQ